MPYHPAPQLEQKTPLIDFNIRRNLALYSSRMKATARRTDGNTGISRFTITIPVTPESLNEVMRYGVTTADVMAIKKKWEKLAIQYMREAQEAGYLPLKFSKKISVQLFIFFEVMRARDQDNYFFVAKGCIDAIAALDMITDDNDNFVDFGGIKFDKDQQNPRVVVEITEIARKDRVGVVNPRNVADIALEALGYDDGRLADYDPLDLQLAYIYSLPRIIRPNMRTVAQYFDVSITNLTQRRNTTKIKDLIIAMVRHNAAYDLPDVVPAIKLSAMDGNVAAQRLYLEYVGQLETMAPININNTVYLSPDHTRAKIAQLESAYATQSANIIEGETVA